MLNTNNYFSKAASIDWDNLPEALAKGHKLVEGASQNNWAAYNSNENIKRVVDAFFQKLSDYLDNNPSAPVQKSMPAKVAKMEPKTASAVKPAAAPINNYKGLKVEIRPASKGSSKFIIWDIVSEQKFANERFDTIDEARKFINQNGMVLIKIAEPVAKEEYESEDVEHIDIEIQFIKRYAAMHGKVKSQTQVLTLLHSLQKAIVERKIRKDSPYAKEIEMMQNQLITCYEKMGDMAEIKIDSKNLKRYLEIAHSQEGMLSVVLLKAYIALNGKRDVKDKADRLFKRIKKSVDQGKITKSDKYADKLNEAYQTLKSYIDGDSVMLNINKAQLNGLMGLLGENLFGQK